MTNRLQQLSRRDIERLSAYIDGELSAKETAQLEARLQAESQLRGALQELKQTSMLLADLPQVRVPRNFILSPEMAGQVQRSWRYPVMQLATALAAFAFLMVIGFDAISSQGLSFGAGAPQLAAEAPVAQEAAPEAMMEAQEEAEMEQPAAEQRAETDDAAENGQADSFGAAEAPAEEEMAEPEMQGTAAPEGEAATLDETENELSAAASATAPPSPTPAATTMPTGLEQPSAPDPTAQIWLRWLEIGLATAVIILAVLTFRLRPGP